MREPTSCCRALSGYRERCDLLVGFPGLEVIGVERADGGGLEVAVESAAGCPMCGVVAHGRGRTEMRLVDAPSARRLVTVLWRKRWWICPEPLCPRESIVGQNPGVGRR